MYLYSQNITASNYILITQYTDVVIVLTFIFRVSHVLGKQRKTFVCRPLEHLFLFSIFTIIMIDRIIYQVKGWHFLSVCYVSCYVLFTRHLYIHEL